MNFDDSLSHFNYLLVCVQSKLHLLFLIFRQVKTCGAFFFSAVVTTMRGMQSSIKGNKRFTCPDFFTSERVAGCFRISIKSLFESCCFSCYNESPSFLLSAGKCDVAANKKCLMAKKINNLK